MTASLHRPEEWERIVKILEDLRAESSLLGIPTVEQGDGMVIQALSFKYSVSGGKLFADLGAGVGYSTAWMLLGVEAGCSGGGCRVLAVEWMPGRAERLKRLGSLLELSNVIVDVREENALDTLESLEDSSLSLVFVDVEKELYPHILKLLESKLESGGAALFHNAFYPKPPERFFIELEKGPWRATISPSGPGLMIAFLER